MALLTAIQQSANDDRTTMRQFMDTVTRRLANPLEPIESLVVNLRALSDNPVNLSGGFQVHVQPPSDWNNPESLVPTWERWMSSLSPNVHSQFLTFIRRRITAANGVPPQGPGGDGAPGPSQENRGIASRTPTEPDRTYSQASRHSLRDEAALLNRIQELEEELRQVRARQNTTTSAPRSSAGSVTRTPFQPSITPGHAPNAVPQASQPPVQERPSDQQNTSTSEKGKHRKKENVDRTKPKQSELNHNETAEDERPNTVSSDAEIPQPPRLSSRNKISGSIKPEPGRRNTVAATQTTGLSSRDGTPGDSNERKRNKPVYSLRSLATDKKNNAHEYEIDKDTSRKTSVGYQNIVGEVKHQNINDSDPNKILKDANDRRREAAKAAEQAKAGTQTATPTAPANAVRRQSTPPNSALATTSASATASQVPPKPSGKRKAVGDLENDRFDDDNKPAKKPELQRANALNDIEEEPENESEASSSSSEEDDDGQGAQSRARKSSNSSKDGDGSQNTPGTRQRATRSTSKTTQGNKGQRVERRDRRNAPSSTTWRRGPQLEEGNLGNDDIQNQDVSQQSELLGEIEDTDTACALNEAFESDNDRPDSDIPDEYFEESSVDDTNPGPADEDQDDEAEGDNDNFEDGCEAKTADEAHIYHRQRPSQVIKYDNAHQPSKAIFVHKRGAQSSWAGQPAKNSNNKSDDRSARTGEKRKSTLPTPVEDSDGKSYHPFEAPSNSSTNI